MKSSKIIWVTILLCRAFCSFGQLNATVYEDFTQTSLNPYLINPSASDTSYSFKGRFNNISELVLVKDVSQFYLDIDTKIKSPGLNGDHYLGLQLTNSKLGEYISRNRFQLRYSWLFQVSTNAKLAAGCTFGFINYAFLTTQGGRGGSDIAPDGSFGIHYLRKGTTIGVSIQQIFTPVLIPINQSFKLDRLYNVDAEHEFVIMPEFSLTPQFVVQFSEEGTHTYGLNLTSEIYDFGVIGLSNFYLRKTSVFAGVQKLNVWNTDLSLVVTYSKFHSDIPLSNGLLEIFIALQK